MLDAISSNGMKEAGYEYVNIDEYAALPPTPGHSSPRIGRTLSPQHTWPEWPMVRRMVWRMVQSRHAEPTGGGQEGFPSLHISEPARKRAQVYKRTRCCTPPTRRAAVVLRSCWQVERFPNGTIQPDPARFPSGMKALADYAHSKGKCFACTWHVAVLLFNIMLSWCLGRCVSFCVFTRLYTPVAGLKFGVYTARGSKTCQGRPGAYAHELVDAKTYCDWGLARFPFPGCH